VRRTTPYNSRFHSFLAEPLRNLPPTKNGPEVPRGRILMRNPCFSGTFCGTPQRDPQKSWLLRKVRNLPEPFKLYHVCVSQLPTNTPNF
jgi:hypothetical protein